MHPMTPREIVSELDRYIVGQTSAKRAVAIALRNRWRRQQVPGELREEISPKNIIMIGPTGVGKTEISRRLAKLAQAPFVKVEASKFTEVGYVGRDVESIIRDLTELAVNLVKEEEKDKVQLRARELAEERYPQTVLLRQVQGVGALTALWFVLVVGDPHRFSKSRCVGAYLGLRPRRGQSGNNDPELRITKTGDKELRRLLVTASHYILGPFGPDTDLRRWGETLAARGRKSAKKRAVVAVARKLAVLLHRLWVTGEEYQELGYGVKAQEAA